MLLLVIRLMWYGLNEEYIMGLVKTRRLAAMQKQQRAKAGMKPPLKCDARKVLPRQFAPGRRQGE